MKKTILMVVLALLCLIFTAKTQRNTITGRVTDTVGNPISGATVTVKGTTTSTQSNVEGFFKLINVPSGSSITVSYIGFKNREVSNILRPDVGDVILEATDRELEEVQINAGYYSVSERARTGNITQVDAKALETSPVSNPLQALQGRVAGLDITQSTGVTGGGFKVQIRGQNSISNGTAPLYIIDGVIFPSAAINNSNSNAITEDASPLSMIDANDIQSVEVLKDADATAIYGSRGANGVILITTKKGLYGPARITASIASGYSQVGHKLDLMNTEQYLSMRTEALQNNNLSVSASDYDINGTWDINKYTNWQDVMIGGTSPLTRSSLNVSGGNENTRYNLSGSYYGEETVFPGTFGYKRGGLNSSLSFGSPAKRLNVTLTTGYSHAYSILPPSDPTVYITWAPNAPDPYDSYGKLNWSYNKVTIANPMAPLLNTIETGTDNLIGNLNLSYKIFNRLFFKTSAGYSNIKRTELSLRPNIAKSPLSNPTRMNRESQFGNNFNTSWIAEPQFTYEATLSRGKISALLGMSFQENNVEYRNILATGFNSDELMKEISSASEFSVSESSSSSYKYAALFARLNYSFGDKYYLNLTGRRDGSSRFGPGKKFANFGAIGAAWLFSEEKFFKDKVSFISFGKIRASYGVTGNDQIANYGYLQLLDNSGTYQGTPTLNTTRIANADYGWETNHKAEAAIQLGLFEDKLNLQIAYFRNRSANQLVFIPLPTSVGTSAILGNLPAIVQNSGLELEGSIHFIRSKNWSWNMGFNLTIPKNRLISYPGLESSTNASTLIVGAPLSIKRYYNTRVDPQTGLYIFDDTDGNGTRNDADRYLNKFIGRLWYGGISNTIVYRNFSLDLLISFCKQQGNSYLSGITFPPGYFVAGAPLNNQPLALLSRWQKPGDQKTIPKFNSTGAGFSNFNLGKNEGAQSLGDASYARLKNISLSYNLPANWLSRINIHRMELSLQGQNIYTLTNYVGLDPEAQLYNRLPPLRTLVLGLKITL